MDSRATLQQQASETRHHAEIQDFVKSRVSEIMTPHVVTVEAQEPVERAAYLMEECDCGALPVVNENGELIGMVTDRDIALRIVGRGRDAGRACVAECMSEKALFCHVNQRVLDCMRQMSYHQVRRIPIVDDGRRVVGMVSQGDLARRASTNPASDDQRAVADTLSAVSEPRSPYYR
jgi:CBS-domain-containing membrane protein